jgi:D-glycero-D-manno-heptose 1,7-bisphosphate phosphatase
VGITNQGGCAAIDPATGKPRKSLEDAIAEQRITLDIFPQLEFILFCPTYDADSHSYLVKRGETAIKLPTPQSVSCRKPGHGMILQAVQLLGTADLVASLMIGDREEDSQCAQSAGVRFVWASEAVKSD